MSPTPRISSNHRPRIVALVASLALAHVAGASPAFAQPKGAAAGTPAGDTKKAVDLFKKAQALYKANKFAEALPIFRESYATVASPNTQLNIARCLAATGDNLGAYLELNALIADVDQRKDPKYQPARDSAVTERDEAANKIALLTVNVANPTPATRLSVGGRDIPRDQWGQPIPLAPGAVDVSVVTPPGAPVSQQLQLQAGEKRPIALDAAGKAGEGPPPPPPGGGSSGSSRRFLRPISYVAGGVGVAGFAMFAIGGGLAMSTYADLDKKCGKGTVRFCGADAKGQIDSGKLEKDLANAGLIIGAVGLAAGVTLFLLSRDGGPKKEGAQPPTEVHAVVSPSYLGLQGTF
jgi:hypothetical protein